MLSAGSAVLFFIAAAAVTLILPKGSVMVQNGFTLTVINLY